MLSPGTWQPLISLLQIVLLPGSIVLSPSRSGLQQPVLTEKLVELYCDLHVNAFLVPLCYNLILILLCAAHGFLTRSLPQNFNESRFIFFSVCTTTFLWVIFIPVYYSAFYKYHRSALLAFSLILNASITMICLFLPKVYAICFITEEDLISSSSTRSNNTTSTSVSVAKASAKVEPIQGVKGETLGNLQNVSSNSSNDKSQNV